MGDGSWSLGPQLVCCMALFILAKFKQQSTTVNSRGERESLVLGQPSISIPLCAKLLFHAHCPILLSCFCFCLYSSFLLHILGSTTSRFSFFSLLLFLASWTWLLSLCVCWCPRWYLILRLFPLRQCGHGIALELDLVSGCTGANSCNRNVEILLFGSLFCLFCFASNFRIKAFCVKSEELYHFI